MRFIERNTRLAYRIEGLRRQNIPEYPMEAVREAITNAVMHRDWFMANAANVFVELYADRIEVISPGALPKGVTVADLGHKTLRRNPLVADLLHRIDFIEKAGTGIRRIRDGAKAVDCPEPVFEADNFVTVTFRPNPEVRQGGGGELGPTPEVPTKLTDQVTPEVTPQVTPEVAPEVAPEVTPEVAPEVTPEVAPEVRVAATIRGEMTARDLRAALRLSDEKHFRTQYLLPAMRAGLIEMTIPEKPRSRLQRYRLTAAGRAYLQQTPESARTTKETA